MNSGGTLLVFGGSVTGGQSMHSSAQARAGGWLLPAAALPAIGLLAMAGLAACSSSTANGASDSSGGAASNLQQQYEHVVDAVLPSVVQITTNNSTGSGVVYDDKGDIVTNEHVVGKATTVQVRPATGNRVLDAKVVGEFATDDLAVDRDGLTPAKFANSNNTRIGEIVLAMGNPLGLTDSVTQGIVSATGRTVSSGEPNGGPALITSAIQTSAAINPGNSGGALVNLSDQVLGIPTLAARDPEAGGLAPGIGFAIPSNTVMNIANQLITYGKVVKSDRASLGISSQTAASQDGEPAGVAVIAVAGGGPADSAGIKSGDIIVALNDHSTPSLQVLENYLADLTPGDKVKVTYTRGTSPSEHTTTVTLGALTG
jgi:putative serine protease PepD